MDDLQKISKQLIEIAKEVAKLAGRRQAERPQIPPDGFIINGQKIDFKDNKLHPDNLIKKRKKNTQKHRLRRNK